MHRWQLARLIPEKRRLIWAESRPIARTVVNEDNLPRGSVMTYRVAMRGIHKAAPWFPGQWRQKDALVPHSAIELLPIFAEHVRITTWAKWERYTDRVVMQMALNPVGDPELIAYLSGNGS